MGDVRSRPAGSPTCPDSLKTIRLWLAGLWNGRIMQEEDREEKGFIQVSVGLARNVAVGLLYINR